MTTLIADSGSTKTDWCLINGTEAILHFTTQGINPVHQAPQDITDILMREVVPSLAKAQGSLSTDISANTVQAIFFYGAGCNAEKSPTVKSVLQQAFVQAQTVEVASDMLGAARALCSNHAGIVCILGTGSNSCYYDGKGIVQNVPPLGYILGDEGSGAVLGKRLVGDCLKKQLPEALCKKFLAQTQLTMGDIIEKVYRQPMANRFLAGLSPFLYENRQEESIQRILTECFNDFICRNILQYPHSELYFTGSIAYYYTDELKRVAETHHYHIASILQRPMEGLITYHTKK